MTWDDHTERAETEGTGETGEPGETEATAALRRALSARFRDRPLPPDLVITTRTEIENREFKAYAAGWRDRGEHDRHRGAEAARTRSPRPPSTEATVLPFPHPSGQPSALPHPNDEQH